MRIDWDRLLSLKNAALRHRARLARVRRPCRRSQLKLVSLPLCIGNTCELDKWEVHATVLHGDGVEFAAHGPPPRRNVRK